MQEINSSIQEITDHKLNLKLYAYIWLCQLPDTANKNLQGRKNKNDK